MATATDRLPTFDALARDVRVMLQHAGVPEPRHDAQALVCWAARLSQQDAWRHRDQIVDDGARERLNGAVDRRLRGEPLAYIVRTAGFRHLDVVVDERVLIPRPETEGLVDHVLAACNREEGRTDSLAALEVGVGSGCVIISLAVEGCFARLIGTDISTGALAVASDNVARAQVASKIELRQGSLYEPVPGERFDVIVSNPPYVTPDEYVALDESVRCYEPEMALVSQPDGLGHIRALCAGAAQHLVQGGLLALEIDSRRADAAFDIALRSGFQDARIERDLFGRSRYLVATMSGAVTL